MTDSRGRRGRQRDVALTVPEQGCVCTEEEQLPYPALAPVVCFGLKQTTRPRNWCLYMTSGPWLDYVSMLVVLLNCVILGMYKPCEETNLNMEVFDGFIFAFFTMEMLIKMVALGVYGYKGSYLSSNWNKLDVVIISGEVLEYFLSFFGLHIQACLVLRPMRLLARVPSMRELVIILLETVPMLANVLILYIFVIHIFSVVGVQLWAGQMRNRCFLGEDVPAKYNVSLSPYFESKYDEKTPFICSTDKKNGMRRCHDVPPYTQDGETCTLTAPRLGAAANKLLPAVAGASANACVNWNVYYNVCRTGDHNPYMGAINFDNIGYALITIFQVVTLEGWTEIMFFIMDSHSFWSSLFFILITIMGSFIMMNVCAVVIATQFSENMERETGEQGADAVAQLCYKLIRCLRRIFHRLRHRDKVRPTGSGSGSDGVVTQAWLPFKKKVKRLVKSKLFDRVIMFAIFLSVITMAVEHHQQPKELTRMLQISNMIFTFVFVVEMVLKLLALALAYFRDRNNIFDFFIVIVSLWEIIAKASGRLSALRAFRLLRFVRLVHFLPYLKRQLLVLKRTMKEAAPLCRLLLFVTFIFSVMGMHLFGCQFSATTQSGQVVSDRKNFDSVLWAMVTVFQILTQEDWNLVLYKAMAATSPWAAFYFVAIIVLGKHVILNVLVGIVVESFQARRSSSDQDSSPSSSESTGSTPTSRTPESDSSPPDINEADGSSKANEDHCRSIEINAAPAPDTNKDNRPLNLFQKVRLWCKEREDWSFYVLSPQNRFRVFCQRVICHKLFDHVVLSFILLSCITIAMERPAIRPKSTERWILKMSRYVFSAVFLVEMLFKVLALGVVFGKDSYCRSSWNVMDGLLVILSLVHIFVSLLSTGDNNMLGILKVLRLLRTFRPLRVIKRAPKLKLAVEALITSVKPIGNIVLICCAFFFFYGILGVQLFKGKFHYCEGQDTGSIVSRADCLAANHRWVRKRYNFDNLGQALMALFVMYSKDGWVNIMYDGLDAVGVDRQPVRNHNQWMLLFFITFMVMSFFLLDMFIGVMVETFHQCQQEQKRGDGEGGRASRGQCNEPEEMPYYTNYSPVRRFIHTVCTSNFLDLFMTVIIFISVLMMAFEHYNQPLYIARLTEYSYYVFTAILIIEVLMKLVAFGVPRFTKNRYNLLDVAVVFVSIISIVFTEMKMADVIPINPSILRVCRVLRLAQVLKAKTIRVLLKTIIKTLSQVGNICLLFMFFFFIYAALGVELFGKLECSNKHPCLGLHRHANFTNFGMALLTLYQVCTGDNWSGIMKDTLRKCRPEEVGCLSYLSWVSPIYFTSFVVMAQFVLVNLVVAAIMQALEDSNENKPTNFCLPPEKVEEQEAKRALQAAGGSVRLSPSRVASKGPSE